VGEIFDLKIEMLCIGKVRKLVQYHDRLWIKRKVIDITSALDMVIRSTIWRTRFPIPAKNLRRRWDAH